MSELLKPPALPIAILNFFASQPDYPAVAGDISEEFQQRAQSSGTNSATRWYWRQVFRNAFALTRRELMRTPIRTTLIALSCLLASNVLTSFFWGLLSLAPPSAWGVFTIYEVTLLVMGLIGGRLLPGREWALALTFTACSICLAGGLRWYYPEIRIHYSASQLASVVLGIVLRQGAFWLGCLWIRVTRVHSDPLAAKGASLHV